MPRPRLTTTLEPGHDSRLTLISAPAGSGKSTLIADWIAHSPGSTEVRTVTLDAADNDPVTFWAYVLHAVGPRMEGLADGVLSAVGSGSPVEVALVPIINHAAQTRPGGDGLVLVLDDYHVIHNDEIHRGVELLVEHLPADLHLAISTRADPPFSLGRLRARGQLNEIRAADLRFTPAEAAEFLQQTMNLDLDRDTVTALAARTEGWIAGLQLAALSLVGRADPESFVNEFAGDDRYIVDYLVDEVLERQPQHVRDFLLRTSILEWLTGNLCDAIVGGSGGRTMLDALDRANLFVVALDNRRARYRYHHLFAEVLSTRLAETHGAEVPELHARASRWHAAAGNQSEAVRHALASGDTEFAAMLIERAWPGMDRQRRSRTWLEWVRALPQHAVQDRPVLNAGYAWALLSVGELEAADARLSVVERWLAGQAGRIGALPGSEVARADDEDGLRLLPVTVANARAYLAQAMGDAPATARFAGNAREMTSSDQPGRRRSTALLAMAMWAEGDLEAANRALADASADALSAGDVQFLVTSAFVRAAILVGLGRLGAAVDLCHETLGLARTTGGIASAATADVHTALAGLYRERGERELSLRHLALSEELGPDSGLTHWKHRWCAVAGQTEESAGNLSGARSAYREAQAAYVRGPVPNFEPAGALEARLFSKQGMVRAAEQWHMDEGLSPADALSYQQEFRHITLARILIAKGWERRSSTALDEAQLLIERLHVAASAARRQGAVIQILVLRALCLAARGDGASAVAALTDALVLAEPEGYARTFLDEGEPMRLLLLDAVAGGHCRPYAIRLLDQMGAHALSAPGGEPHGALIEPLTPREREILGLVAAGLRNQEIAEQLVISLPTVKRHIANTYGKLGAGHRAEAIARANALGLL
ncbi:MAG: LuxR C-terminal-related transcriptional regulator [Dehalococcoidia bacterium]